MSKQGDNRNIRVLQFLDAYERQESLWNPALESYKNKLARDEAYMHIIKELKVPDLTIHDIKLKVKSIRTTYTKELRLLTKNKEEGKPYLPKLFWFNRANAFLRNVSLSRDKRGSSSKQNMNTDDFKHCGMDYVTDISNRQNHDDEACEDISNEEEDPANTSSTSYDYKRIQTTSLDAHQEEPEQANLSENQTIDDVHIHHDFQPNVTIDTKFSTTPPSDLSHNNTAFGCQQSVPNTSSDDEYDLFCRSVAIQLRSISDTYSRSVAKLKIQQILFEAETGHYRNSPCITIPVSQHVNNI